MKGEEQPAHGEAEELTVASSHGDRRNLTVPNTRKGRGRQGASEKPLPILQDPFTTPENSRPVPQDPFTPLQNTRSSLRAEDEAGSGKTEEFKAAFLQQDERPLQVSKTRKGKGPRSSPENSRPLALQSPFATPSRGRTNPYRDSSISQFKQSFAALNGRRAATYDHFRNPSTPTAARDRFWQIGDQPAGTPPSTRVGSGRHGPWDIDKEFGLSPRREGESSEEHVDRIHDETMEEERASKREREEEKMRREREEEEERSRKRGRRGKGRASL